MAGRISYYGGIVKNGLVLDLDAAKRDSYAGVGTAWNDISGNRNNGILENTPTFSSANGGSIVFDGTNDYVSLSLSSTILINFTWEFTFRYTSTGMSLIMTRGNNNQGCWMGLSSTAINFTIGSVADYTYNKTFTQNEIYILTYVINNNIWMSYINGILDNQITINSNRTQNTTNRWVSAVSLNIDNSINTSTYRQQTMYSYKYYNRALSASEVLQNYNATKGRYL